MKKLSILMLSSVLLFSAIGCTSNTDNNQANRPEQTNTETTDKKADSSAQTADNSQASLPDQGAKNDATSETRRNQLDSDIRAREQRTQALGNQQQRDDDDLASEVRSKLEANIPNGKLLVQAQEGNVTLSGTVINEDQITKVNSLTKQINGVKSVTSDVKVAPIKQP